MSLQTKTLSAGTKGSARNALDYLVEELVDYMIEKKGEKFVSQELMSMWGGSMFPELKGDLSDPAQREILLTMMLGFKPDSPIFQFQKSLKHEREKQNPDMDLIATLNDKINFEVKNNRMIKEKKDPRFGQDMCFSPPKEVSILFGMCKTQEDRDSIIGAFKRSVEKTMTKIDGECRGRVYDPETGGIKLVAVDTQHAAFLHFDSRPTKSIDPITGKVEFHIGDMGFHYHVNKLNSCREKGTGKYCTIDVETNERNKIENDKYFLKELTNELILIGIDMEKTYKDDYKQVVDCVKVKGIEYGFKQLFSKRLNAAKDHAQLDGELEPLHAEKSSKQIRKIASKTREAKAEHQSTFAKQENWIAQAEAYAKENNIPMIDTKSLMQAAGSIEARTSTLTIKDIKAMTTELCLASKIGCITETELISHVLKCEVDSMTNTDELIALTKSALVEMSKDLPAISRDMQDGLGKYTANYYTTPEVVRMEQFMEKFVQRQENSKADKPINMLSVLKYIENEETKMKAKFGDKAGYSICQKNAIINTFDNSQSSKSEKLQLILGLPGTGKSFQMKALKEIYEANGQKCIFTGVSNAAATALDSALGLKGTETLNGFVRQLKQKNTLNGNSVIFVDEITLSGIGDIHDIMGLVDEAAKNGQGQAKLVFVGDPEQCSSVNYAGEVSFATMIKQIRAGELNIQLSTLETVNRQKAGTDVAKIASTFMQHDVKITKISECIELLEKNKWMHKDNDLQKLKEQFVEMFVSDNSNTKQGLAHTNDMCLELNEMIQARIARDKGLKIEDATQLMLRGKEGVNHDKVRLFEGDRICIYDNFKKKKSLSGDLGEEVVITKTDQGTYIGVENVLDRNGNSKKMYAFQIDSENGAGSIVRFEEHKLPRMTLSYVQTIMSSQGKSYDSTHGWVGDGGFGKESWNVFLTRQKEQMQIYGTEKGIDSMFQVGTGKTGLTATNMLRENLTLDNLHNAIMDDNKDLVSVIVQLKPELVDKFLLNELKNSGEFEIVQVLLDSIPAHIHELNNEPDEENDYGMESEELEFLSDDDFFVIEEVKEVSRLDRLIDECKKLSDETAIIIENAKNSIREIMDKVVPVKHEVPIMKSFTKEEIKQHEESVLDRAWVMEREHIKNNFEEMFEYVEKHESKGEWNINDLFKDMKENGYDDTYVPNEFKSQFNDVVLPVAIPQEVAPVVRQHVRC